MSQHYLIDLFGNPITSARIIDMQEPANDQTLLNGCFIVRVPDGVSVQNPVSLTDLLNQKYQGLLAENAGFAYVTFDDLLDASHVDPTSGPGFFGQRSLISLAPGAVFSSVINGGAGTPLTGSAPAQALVTWELFTVSDTDASGALFQRTYVEVASSPSLATCQVSFNGGATYVATTDSSIINVQVTDQGTAFIIQLTNVSGSRLFIASWAVVY